MSGETAARGRETAALGREAAAGAIRWNEAGLAPAVVQHRRTGRVLMLGWMNREALERTLSSGEVHFFSRRRGALWKKGETSGNILRLRSIRTDCDRDALLVEADPAGPTCHTGEESCFFEALTGDGDDGGHDRGHDGGHDRGDDGGPEGKPAPGLAAALTRLAALVDDRAARRPGDSYTARLLAAGAARAAQKVGEEGVETALAAAAGTEEEVASEAADLLYHLLVLLKSRGVPPDRVGEELARRFPGEPDGRARPGAGLSRGD